MNIRNVTEKDLIRALSTPCATLDKKGTVPDAQVAGQVTDVLEFATRAGFPAEGSKGKFYVDKGTGKAYEWSGTEYVESPGAPEFIRGKADVSSLAPVATSGNYDDLRGKPGNVSAFANDAGYLTSHQQLRYAMPESVALTPSGDAATLVCADRAVTNATIASGFSTLNLTFPAAVSGYVRDFYLRITVAAGESAPAISVPQGITIENAGGAVPEIADGEASAAATTLVWFSETAPGVFTAKSETVKAIV